MKNNSFNYWKRRCTRKS